MSSHSQASREGILKEIKSIRVGKEQQLRQVHVPENAYKMARNFLKQAPNFDPDHRPIRFKKLFCLSEGDTIYTLLIRDAGDTPLSGAKDKIVDWKAATNAFTRYALNLLLAPNRPEFLRMKLSTSFYIIHVAKRLKEAEKILVCMGYVCSAEPYEVQEYKYAGDVKTEHIAEVLADLVILHSELDLIQGIVHAAINEKYVNILLCDILRARGHPHEDLGAALQSSTGEAHRRMYRYAPKVRSELRHLPQLQRRQSPQLQHAQHAVTVPQPSGSGQQFHQSTAPAAYYVHQNRLSPRSSPSIQRRTQNAQANAETLYQQNNLGVQAQTVSQQHVHQGVYHNYIPYTGAQSTNIAPPDLSQQQQLYVNWDFKPQYADSKGLNRDIPKQPNTSACGASPKDPYNYCKVEIEQRPHADSKLPDPMDLPEPMFDGNNPPPPPIEPYSDNLSLMADLRSVQSGLSGPNLDSMLSSGRSLGEEFQPGVRVPGYDFNNTNAQAPGNISRSTHHSSEKCDERETPKAEEKYLTPASGSQGHAQGAAVTSSNGDQSNETELSKPHSNPHNKAFQGSYQTKPVELLDPDKQLQSEKMLKLDQENTKLRQEMKEIQREKRKIEVKLLKQKTECQQEKVAVAAERERLISSHSQTVQQLRYQLTQKDSCIQELQQQLDNYSKTEDHNVRYTQLQVPPQEQDSWNVPRDEVEITGEIGRGGWGAVFKGRFRGQTVAVKKAFKEILGQPYTIRLMKREIQIMASVQHPNLVRFIAAVIDDKVDRGEETPLLVVELLDMDLRCAYKTADLSSDRIPIFRDVAYALHYLHEHQEPIIHRDVSAPNVLLERLQGGTFRAKLSDFGSANKVKDSRTAGPGAICYTAPEAFPPANPEAPVPPQTPKVDVYSYGILLAEVVTKTMPTTENRRQLFHEIKKTWSLVYDLICSCTKPTPTDRPTMATILGTLNRIPTPRPRR